MSQKNNLRVLVVEDHSFQREYIANCLKLIGINQIEVAADGREALDVMSRYEESGKNIDIIICDLQMPNMDGVEYIRHLAERQYKGAIIILTAMDSTLVSSVTRMVREYKLNFIGSLHKPVDSKKLINYITEATESTKQEVNPPLPAGIEEKDLIAAIENGGLIAYFQPKFSFTDRKVVGVEALARLKLPDGQIISPDKFMYLYKKLNKTEEFELKIYDQTFKLLRGFIENDYPIRVNVNCCANLLGMSTYFEKVIKLAEKHAIPNDLITIEITERSLINNLAKSIEFLARLRINGFNLSVDDFGIGYSSIKQLEMLPFNELKIDKSFILGIEVDKQKQAIVESIAGLAKNMNLRIVAEGIETQEAWDIAKGYGCDVCQGYLTGKPMPKEELEVEFMH